MIGSKSRCNGFSLLEVMIAMFLLMFGLLAIVALFETGAKALQSGDKRTLAAQFTKNKMEALRLSNPARSSNGADLPQGMTRIWAVQRSGNDPTLWVVSVNVTWKNMENRDHSVSLKSFVFY